jgi:hypothetical protein
MSSTQRFGEAEAVKATDGQLPWAVALRDRVRYFPRGGVLGTKEFVNRIFRLKRDRFPINRRAGARVMRGGVWGELTALRDLQER